MKDVARSAEVSTATVSRAFAKPDQVSTEVRERIMAAAARLNYTLNSAARSLRRNDTNIVLVVVPDIGNPFFSKLLKGIEQQAHALSYSVLIGDTGDAAERVENYARHLDARRADGLILLNGQTPSFNGFRTERFVARPDAPRSYPVVVVSERIPDANLPTVGIDNVAAAREAVLHLIGLGHRRIAHIAGPPANILTKERQSGYQGALAAKGLAADPRLLIHGDFSVASGRRAALWLMDTPEPPSAIFCANDEMAMGAITTLKSRSLNVPGDVSVVGFDDIEFSEIFDPPLTTVHQPRFAMGKMAMTLIGRALQGEEIGFEEAILPSPLVTRASTAPALPRPAS